MPIEWADLDSHALRSDSVDIRNVWDWLRDHDDPWKGMDGARRPLPELDTSDMPDRSGRRRGVSRQERARR